MSEPNAIILTESLLHPPDMDLAYAALAAKSALRHDVFQEYHKNLRPHTRKRQLNDLKTFSTYLHAAGVERSPEALMHDPAAWYGMNYALLRGYVVWSLQEGYATGTINVRLATLRQYCFLAGPEPDGVGIINELDLAAIQSVKGFSNKQARNIDQDRERAGQETRRGDKKAEHTMLTTAQALALKKQVPEKHKRSGKGTRPTDGQLSIRDAFLMGLMIEHALRCGEVAGLNIENFDLSSGILSFYREKTDKHETHRLNQHTRMAAETYLQSQNRKTGPLFLGYAGRRLTPRAINERVRQLGKDLQIETLSPHDLRHFWAYDALRNKTPLDRVKAGGGWRSDSMPLRYAQRTGIDNEGVIITEEDLARERN